MSDDLLDRLDRDDAEGWKPTAGDKIAGVITDLSTRQGDWDPYPLVEVETADGRLVAIHAFHTVLRNEIEARNVHIGDTIAVKYLGKAKPKKAGGAEFEAYKVLVQPGPDNPGLAPNTNTAAAATKPDAEELF